MRPAQHTTFLTVVSSISLLGLGVTQTGAATLTHARPAALATHDPNNDDDFWDDMDLLRFLLCCIIPCPQAMTAQSADPAAVEYSIKDLISQYRTLGLRPNLTPADLVEGKNVILAIFLSLDAHPGVMDPVLEAEYRSALEDAYAEITL